MPYRRGIGLIARGALRALRAQLAAPCWGPFCRKIITKAGQVVLPQQPALCRTCTMARTQKTCMLCLCWITGLKSSLISSPLGAGTPGVSWYHTVPGQHVENSAKQTVSSLPHFSVLSHLQTNSNSRKLKGFAFPMIEHWLPPLLPEPNCTVWLAGTLTLVPALAGWHSNKSMTFRGIFLKHLIQLEYYCSESWNPVHRNKE